MSADQGCTVEVPQSEISMALDRLASAIDQQNGALCGLRGRCGDVLAEEPPKPGRADGEREGGRSAMEQRLDNMLDNLRTNTAIVDDIIDRLRL